MYVWVQFGFDVFYVEVIDVVYVYVCDYDVGDCGEIDVGSFQV